MGNTAGSGAQTLGLESLKCQLGTCEKQVMQELARLEDECLTERIWRKDAGVWTGSGEQNWLGWLDVVSEQLSGIKSLEAVSADTEKAGFTQALLLGMGGSSLCVEVMRRTFGTRTGYPDMFVLDSTVPAQVAALRRKLDLAKTLIIVASKSGSTTEPNVMAQYFYDQMKKAVGDAAGSHFAAITDPGSSMEKTARKLGFRKVYYGVLSIGGRFSVLSNFGMVPAAVMGLDVARILRAAGEMVSRCGPETKIQENPGALLGTIMGTLSRAGRDKVTIITSPGIAGLSAWLEQLLAESTGKQGKGLIPVASEKLDPPGTYGSDRLFVYMRLATAPDTAQDAAVQALASAGHPVIRLEIRDVMDLGAEFFRWEYATAVAGAVLGINAFDQPNVQESKDYTRKLLGEYAGAGKLPEDPPICADAGMKLYADKLNQEYFEKTLSGKYAPAECLTAHLSRLAPGDYFALNCYLDQSSSISARLEQLRTLVMEHYHVATTLGFGPRFLHSTGQLHKGGPDSGVFLQITSDDREDLSIPGEPFTFGVLKQAQALGDYLALGSRHRRLLRLHLGAEVEAGLDRLLEIFRSLLT